MTGCNDFSRVTWGRKEKGAMNHNMSKMVGVTPFVRSKIGNFDICTNVAKIFSAACCFVVHFALHLLNKANNMKNESRNSIIEANQPLTLKIAKSLPPDTCIVVCVMGKDGKFNEYTDTVMVKEVAKMKGAKGYLLMHYDFTYSYVCLNGEVFTTPTGETVYFIKL